MSGHSKWSTIKRQKEAKDAKRGQIFTKLASAITVAVRTGGSDLEANFRLRLAVDKARSYNMPKENIARAIERVAGGGGDELEEASFEGFLPGGAAVVIWVLTDNKLRTREQVREVLERGGGTLAGGGAVGYLFSQKGELKLKSKQNQTKEAQELEIIDAGIEAISEDEEGGWWVDCEKDKTFEVKRKLEELGYVVESAELVMKPAAGFRVDDEDQIQKMVDMLEKLEDLSDVQKVWTNYQG